MNSKKIIKVLEAAKANNGLSREEIKKICGKETDAIVEYLHIKDVCVWLTNGSIIKLKRGKAALLIDKLKQEAKDKRTGALRWLIETILSPLGKL